METPMQMMGGANRIAPLISFNSLVDTDIGLLIYVYNEYDNDKIFDLSLFDDFQSLLYKVYNRREKNPLYCIMKNENDKQFLDECYEEFINTKEKEILSYSITTEIKNAIIAFNTRSSKEVVPSILYYTDNQLDILKNEPYLSHNEFIKFPLSKNAKQSYDCFFIKSIDEIDPFIKLKSKTFYISSLGLNLNEDNTDINDTELIVKIIRNNNQYSIFDMYNFRKDIED